MLQRVVLLLACLFATPITAQAVNVGGIEVGDPGGSVGGRSVAEYTALWWKYVLETPASTNPFVDPGGALFAPGPFTGDGVTFLYGAPSTDPATPVTRSVSVSAGTNLLVPLIQWVNLKTDPAETAADLLNQLEPLVAGTTNLFAEINGIDFATATSRDLLTYRETFGLPGDSTFGVTFPSSDPVFPGFDGFATDLIVADGHWLLLRGIPVGELSVRFGGTNASGESVDVSYLLNVVPEPTTWTLLGVGLAGLGFVRRKA